LALRRSKTFPQNQNLKGAVEVEFSAAFALPFATEQYYVRSAAFSRVRVLNYRGFGAPHALSLYLLAQLWLGHLGRTSRGQRTSRGHLGDRRDVFCYFVRPLKRYPQRLAILNRMRHWKTFRLSPVSSVSFKGAAVEFASFRSRCGNSLLRSPQPIQFTAFISHLTNSNGCGNLYPKVLLTVSPFRPSFSPQSKVYPQPFGSCTPCAPKSPFVFNRLRTLYLSCRSFCDSCPLFSITSALFDKNTGGRVSRSGLRTLGGSRRRLPVPETKLRDTRGGIPALPSASTALIIPTSSKGFNGPWVRFPSSPLPHLRPLLRSPPFCVSTFRINTSKSVSKQTTLTSFRMNTYGKTGGRGQRVAIIDGYNQGDGIVACERKVRPAMY
jgi:hypothetical protein